MPGDVQAYACANNAENSHFRNGNQSILQSDNQHALESQDMFECLLTARFIG